MICNIRIATPIYIKIFFFAIYNKSGLSLIYAKFSHTFQKCISQSIQFRYVWIKMLNLLFVLNHTLGDILLIQLKIILH